MAINHNTILSVHDDRLTLLKWLKEVENALSNASLTSIAIEKVSTTNYLSKYQITATFADASEITSDQFTLPDASIVTEFDNLADLVNAFDTRISSLETGKQDALDAYSLLEFLEGTDEIIADVNEAGTKVEFHLDNDVSNKINRALLTPLTAPTEKTLVGVDTSNAQIQVKVGEGLSLEGSTSPYTLKGAPLLSSIVDSDGHKRFIKGDIYEWGITGLTYTYSKWALSGTHLTFVIAGFIESGAIIGNHHLGFIANEAIPSWIRDKIIPSGDSYNLVEGKNMTLWLDATTAASDVIYTGLRKIAEGIYIDIWHSTNVPISSKTYFRICYDLLITA